MLVAMSVVAGLMLAALYIPSTIALRPPKAKPNIAVVVVDDLGYGDPGFAGHPSNLTPELDKLAQSGKRLNCWYTAYAVCSASRTAILTGRQPPRVGMVGVINSLSVAGLPLTETTLGDHMKALGYRTLAIGKWHQGQQPAYLPTARGFDVFHGLPFSVDDGTGIASGCDGQNLPANTRLGLELGLGLGPQLPLPLIKQNISANLSIIEQQPADLTTLTATLMDTILAFTEEYRDDPMLLYIATPHVHTATPNISPDLQYSGCSFQNTTTRGRFGDALAEVDWLVGTLVNQLKTLGIDKNTLLLFFSDNGPSLRWGLGAGSMGIFTGSAATFANGSSYTNTGKGSTWEGGIRMPAFAYWPGTIAAGSRTTEIISSLDILPTAVSLAGSSLPRQTVIDGRDASSILLSKAGKSLHTFLPFYNNPVYSNASTTIFAARFGKWKFHFVTSPGLGNGRWPWHGPSPQTVQDPPLVFDIDRDPSETFPIGIDELPNGVIGRVLQAKQQYEIGLKPVHIDPRFGYEWALCCGVGCLPSNGTCNCVCKNANLPPP